MKLLTLGSGYAKNKAFSNGSKVMAHPDCLHGCLLSGTGTGQEKSQKKLQPVEQSGKQIGQLIPGDAVAASGPKKKGEAAVKGSAVEAPKKEAAVKEPSKPVTSSAKAANGKKPEAKETVKPLLSVEGQPGKKIKKEPVV